MNKSEFIEYIDKLPDSMEFTPMKVEVRGIRPQKDGYYEEVVKKIKFECQYVQEVHKLDFHSSNLLTPIDWEVETEEEEFFQKKVNRLKKAIERQFKIKYESSPHLGDALPVAVLSALLHEYICYKPESFYESLHNKIRDILTKLANCIDYDKKSEVLDHYPIVEFSKLY